MIDEAYLKPIFGGNGAIEAVPAQDVEEERFTLLASRADLNTDPRMTDDPRVDTSGMFQDTSIRNPTGTGTFQDTSSTAYMSPNRVPPTMRETT